MWYEVSGPAINWRSLRQFLLLALLLPICPVASGQVNRFDHSINVTEIFTDNVDATRNGRSDWITEVAPTISVHRTSGHVTGSLDASWVNVLYLEEGSQSTSYITLNGNAQIEAVDDSLFIDIRSSVGRNNLSSFQGRPQWDSLSTSNQTETRYISIAPRWVGHVGKGDTQFSVSYDGQALAYGSDMSNQSMGTFRARLFNPTAGKLFGWSIDYADSDNTYHDSNQQNVSDRSLRGTLTYYATPQLSLRAIAGTETDNYTTGGENQTGAITGAGFNWRPTPRTSVDGTFENHVYGDTYDFRFSHRRPLATFDLSLTRGVTSSYQTATNSFGSYYYNLISSSLRSQYPDPAQLDQATRQTMKQLGISSSSTFGNFATNSFFFDQRIQAGVSLIGSRHTLALSVYRSDQQQVNKNQVLSPDDSFANNNNVKDWGATASLTHQFTPTSNLNATLFLSQSNGSGGGPSQSSRDKAFIVGYSRQLGGRTFASVNYRHETSSGDDPFDENSVWASLALGF